MDEPVAHICLLLADVGLVAAPDFSWYPPHPVAHICLQLADVGPVIPNPDLTPNSQPPGHWRVPVITCSRDRRPFASASFQESIVRRSGIGVSCLGLRPVRGPETVL